MTPGPKLVIGANGFLGSHVTRQLVERGADVRVMVREGAKTMGIDDLAVQRFYGDMFDTEVVREAMPGCGTRRHCSARTSKAPEVCSRLPGRWTCGGSCSPAAT